MRMSSGLPISSCSCSTFHSKGEREKAFHHFETSLGIAATLNWHNQLVFGHYSMAEIFIAEDGFSDAQAHIEKAKSHAIEGTYQLGIVMVRQAFIWFQQSRLKDARSEILAVLEIFEKFGATQNIEDRRVFLTD